MLECCCVIRRFPCISCRKIKLLSCLGFVQLHRTPVFHYDFILHNLRAAVVAEAEFPTVIQLDVRAAISTNQQPVCRNRACIFTKKIKIHAGCWWIFNCVASIVYHGAGENATVLLQKVSCVLHPTDENSALPVSLPVGVDNMNWRKSLICNGFPPSPSRLAPCHRLACRLGRRDAVSEAD